MTFYKLALHDDECNCLKNAIEDTENYYTRRIKSPKPDASCFITKWEEGKGHNLVCEKLCDNIKSVSINKWSTTDVTTQNDILKKYITKFTIRPLEDAIIIFKFPAKSSLIKQSGEVTHHDLFKSDSFSIDLIDCKVIILSETEISI